MKYLRSTVAVPFAVLAAVMGGMCLVCFLMAETCGLLARGLAGEDADI